MPEEKVHTEEAAPEEKVHTEETGQEEQVPEQAAINGDRAGEPVQEQEAATKGEAEEERGDMEEMAEQDWNLAAEDEREEPDFWEEEPKKRSFFHRNREEAHFLRDKWILSRISDADLMEYLVLEQKRNEQMQKARDIREKRIVSAFKLTVSLAAAVAVVYFLKDNPTIFVNILYIGGILGGFWFWKNPREK